MSFFDYFSSPIKNVGKSLNQAGQAGVHTLFDFAHNPSDYLDIFGLFGGDSSGPLAGSKRPTREDAIQNILNNQLSAIKKKKMGGMLGTYAPADTNAPTASQSLFGVTP